MTTYEWSFRQLSGSNPKTIVLKGYAAPFGRPRKDPVVKETFKIRVQTTNYPGKNHQPTRHILGSNYEPIELKGRWMTKHLGEPVDDYVARWKEFVDDRKLCQIAWGWIVSYTGLIEEIEIARESQDEIAWRMRILVDKADGEGSTAPKATPSLTTGLGDISVKLDALKLKTPKSLMSMLNDIAGFASEFEDQVDGFVRDLSQPAAALNRLVSMLENTEKATFSMLQHLRQAVKGIEIAFTRLQVLVMNTELDSAMTVRSAARDIAWAEYQFGMEVEGARLLAQLAEIDRLAEIQQQQEVVGVIMAKTSGSLESGESWESLSTRATGGPGAADRIRDMNGGGAFAISGEDYVF